MFDLEISNVTGHTKQTKIIATSHFGKEGKGFGILLIITASGLIFEFIMMLWAIFGMFYDSPLLVYIPLGADLYYRLHMMLLLSNLINLIITVLGIIFAFNLQKHSNERGLKAFPDPVSIRINFFDLIVAISNFMLLMIF